LVPHGSRVAAIVSGPFSINEAKAAAIAMAKAAVGEEKVIHPVAHLNRLQAKLVDAPIKGEAA
jgi:hypothetical protein